MASRSLRLALAGLLLLALSPRPARAEDVGQIVGRVVDAATGRGLPGAQVAVQGTTLRATAGVEGRYTLRGVPEGPRTVTVTLLGYAGKTVTDVRVPAGGAVALDVSLAAQAMQLEGLTVTAARERGSVGRALDEQRTAAGIVNATTAEAIARTPDGDAAQAVQRVSGVTVQDGRYVFVRGLGERYTTTSLNGARIPSPEPEKKVVPLDLFPSALLESITTSKTFTPDQPGDFSGALVNLKTRSFPARRTASFSLSGGWTDGATGREVPAVPGSGWLAMDAGGRGLPPVLGAAGDFGGLTQGDLNLISRSFRDVWSPEQASGPPNLSGNLSVGGEDPVFGQRIGYVGSLTYSRGQDLREGEVRARAVPDAEGRARPHNVFRGSTGTSSVLWGGLFNLSTFLGGGDHKLELNNAYNRSGDGEAHLDWGTLEEFTQIDSVRRTSLRYVERSVRSHQLRGEHALLGAALDWSAAHSRVTRVEPDRADLLYGYETAPTGERLPLSWLGFLSESAKRTFGDLDERAWSGDLNLALPFGPAGREGRVKVGGAYRSVTRDADARAYNLRSIGLTPEQRRLSPEEIFDGRFAQGEEPLLYVEPNTSGGFYTADDRVAAGYAMAEYLFGSRVKVIAGARVERWELGLESEPTTGGRVATERANTDVLPSLAVNVRLTDAQNLRLSASQTLSRPEYRELSPIGYRDVIEDREVFGNPGLVRTLVQNYDARWEWYPGSGEVLSLGAFAKRFRNPIEPIEVATTGETALSFANAASAFNYGLEVEVRKELGSFSEALEPFTVFTNATVMRSEIDLGNDSLSAATNDQRPMVGQAPYVVNAGVAWTPDGRGRTSATLLYNVVGRRLTAAALAPLRDDAYEQPRHGLDFSLRFPLRGGLAARLDAENLLNSPVEVRQGGVTRLRYTTGRTLTFGVSWKP